MEGGKKVFGGVGRLIVFLIISHTAYFFSSALYAGNPVWVKARSGITCSALSPDIALIKIEGDFYGLITAVSNPYSISGLYDSFLKVGIHSGKNDLWLAWSFISHHLYREDDLDFLFIREFLPARIYAGVAPSVRGIEVTGFQRKIDFSLKSSVGIRLAEEISISYETGFCEPELSKYWKNKISVSITSKSFGILVSHGFPKRYESDFRVGLEACIDRNLVFLSGYRLNTDEFSVGLVFRRGGWCTGFSWSGHPVLGSTYSAGVGRFWRK